MRFFDYQRSNPKETPSRSSSTNSSDESDGNIEPPSMTQFFADASLYKQAIVNPDRKSFYRATENETVQDFAELVGRHLDAPERTLAGRFARLSVEDNDWFPEEKQDGRVVSDEPEELPVAEEVPPVREDVHNPLFSEDAAQPSKHVVQHSEATPLSAEEIVELLRQEHGDLAPEGEERLIVESDAALMQDVIILGVLHITTHRIAFHASLLDESKTVNQIIKAGPAIVHRKGLHRKRRLWLELTRDFLCAFLSAQETDRMRPQKSVLLSTIKEVCPEDPAEPLVVRAIHTGHDSADESSAHLEFDTLESARDWRREIAGAVFLYKRSLLATMQGVEEDNDGVRMSIPLQCVEDYNLSTYMDTTLHIITLSLSNPTPDDDNSSTSSERSIQSVEFVATSLTECQGQLNEVIEAREKLLEAASTDIKARKVVVDYGSLGIPQPAESADGVPPRSREQVICDAIGIGASPDVWMTQSSVHGVTISSGFFVVTPQWVGFWSKSLALKDQRYRISIPSIQVAKAVAPPGNKLLNLSNPNIHMVLDIQGNPSLRFHFRSEETRNEAIKRVNSYISASTGDASSASTSLSGRSTPIHSKPPSPPLTPPPSSAPASIRSPTLTSSLSSSTTDTSISSKPTPPTSPNGSSGLGRRSSAMLAPTSRSILHANKHVLEMSPQAALKLPKAINLPRDTVMPIPASHIVCLTIGSRGDVQPYIALGLGLKKSGHRVTIVTHEEYKGWVESFGIGHRTAGGDPGMLMKLSVENKMFSPQFFKESISNYRKWLDKLLIDAWEQCKDAKILLESPYAMGGVHIAEALNIPYFRVCTMPWTKTTQFPHPFISPPVETPRFNSMSYVLFDNVFWAATSTQINRWRSQYLHLPPTDMSHLAQSKIPIIYNFSPSVVPKPLDWNDTAIESGYWFLDNPDGSWTPPPALSEFMAQARSDGKPIVYIGFGSITVPNPHAVTEKIYQAVIKSDVRAIISKGWSARMAKNVEKEPEMPKECYVIDKIPHDWLFPRIDAALHHGGAGTTSASLRAGIPTLIKPWFGDQYFWASRVHKLGAGMRVSSLRVNDLAAALTKATTDRIMKEKASIVGEKIRSEDGVLNAMRFINIYLTKAVRTPQREMSEH